MENDRPWASDPPLYFNNKYYHTSTDSMGTLNYSLLRKVTQLALASVARLSMDESLTNVAAAKTALSTPENSSSTFPNPFNNSTCIRVNWPQATEAEVSICNLMGQKIAILHQGKVTPGSQSYYWNADGEASGIYFCRIQSANNNQLIKLTLVR
jgi:hypothetical protein